MHGHQNRGQAGHQQGRAEVVNRLAGGLLARVLVKDRNDRNRDDGNRDVNVEDPVPAPGINQPPTEQGPNDRSCPEAGAGDPQDLGPLAEVLVNLRKDDEGDRVHPPGPNSHHSPGNDEPQNVGCQALKDGSHHEHGRGADIGHLVSLVLTKLAPQRGGHRHSQQEGGHDPAHVLQGVQVASNRWQGGIDDRPVHSRHDVGQQQGSRHNCPTLIF